MTVTSRYVALGDSMSIDDYAGGPGRGAAGLRYRNLNTDLPARAGRDLSSNGLSGIASSASGWSMDVPARDGAVSHPD